MFYRFGNKKIWYVVNNRIQSTVFIKDYKKVHPYYESVAAAIAGSDGCFTDLQYEHIGGGIVKFSAQVDLEGYAKPISKHSFAVRKALRTQFGMSELEVTHALIDLEADYGEEAIIEISGSHRQIRRPAEPTACTYVRVLAGGFEVAYWVDDEWGEDPTVVMGAFTSAALGH